MSMAEEQSDRVAAITDKARTETIYGEPRQIGDVTIIPVGKVTVNFGFGGGRGKGPNEGNESSPEGEGAGGGGRVTVSPVAVIRIRDGVEEIVPVVDKNQVIKYVGIVAGIVAFWLGLAIARLARPRKK
jgi:uncharacterized spore protein YtfJ